MRTYFLIFKILHNRKQIIKSLIHLFVIFLIVANITESFFQKYADYIQSVWPVKYAKYDVHVKDTTEKDYREQVTQNNVEAEVMFSQPVWSGKFICDKKEFYHSQETNKVYGVSLGDNPLQTVVELILPGCIIKKDESLLSLENAILISDEIAMQIGSKVGDTIYTQLPVNEFRKVNDYDKDGFDDDLIYEFKVAAIYRQINIGNAVVRHDIFRKIGIDWIGEEVYNEYHFNYKNDLFIRFKDKRTGMNELKNFIPTSLGDYINYGDEWKQKMDDYNDYKRVVSLEEHYTDRELLYKQTEKRMVVDTDVILFHTILVAAAIALLFINNNYKVLKLNNNGFGVLTASGMPRKKLLIYISLTSFIEQCLVFLLAHLRLAVTFHISGMTEYSLTLNTLVIIRMYAPLIICAVISSIISGFFAINIVSKKKMLEALSGE